MKISLVIVTYHRLALLCKCLESISAQWKNDIEVIIVINGQDQKTHNFLSHYPIPLTIIPLDQSETPAHARNIALKQVNSDLILFLDDDTELPHHFIEHGLDFAIKNPHVEAFGGPDCSAENAPMLEKLIGLALQSPLVTAHTRHRHTANSNPPGPCGEESLILCALWFRKRVFSEYGLQFDERFFRNEENVLLYQLSEQGAQLYRHPQLEVIHHKRTNISQVLRGVFLSGYYRAQSLHLKLSKNNILFYLPTLSLLVFCLTLFLSLKTAIALMLIYLISIIIALLFTLTISYRYFLGVVVLHPLIHLSYAIGFLNFIIFDKWQFPLKFRK